jgi:hypothetical protein
MSLVGNFSTCSVLRKEEIIASQRNKVFSKQVEIDVYLEGKDCASVSLWDRKRNGEKQEAFDHYQ